MTTCPVATTLALRPVLSVLVRAVGSSWDGQANIMNLGQLCF